MLVLLRLAAHPSVRSTVPRSDPCIDIHISFAATHTILCTFSVASALICLLSEPA